VAAARGAFRLNGHLHLVCAAAEKGRSFLREQSFRAPMHISKPFADGDTLVVNVVNPTAGLFAGDHVTSEVRVENGARLLLTSPSATRVHRMESGEARCEQTFSVAAGGFLEVLPELFIPQNSARYVQKTRIEVARGGGLIFWEMLAPGRVASGEAFAFSHLEWTTDLFFDGKKSVRERYRLAPGNGSLGALQKPFPNAYYASAFVIGLECDVTFPASVNALHADGVWIGCSLLAHGGFVIKIVAADSVVLRRTLFAGRELTYAQLGKTAPGLRRV
jgi:urease accessory protein